MILSEKRIFFTIAGWTVCDKCPRSIRRPNNETGRFELPALEEVRIVLEHVSTHTGENEDRFFYAQPQPECGIQTGTSQTFDGRFVIRANKVDNNVPQGSKLPVHDEVTAAIRKPSARRVPSSIRKPAPPRRNGLLMSLAESNCLPSTATCSESPQATRDTS
jgi:hypothetical protein